MDEILIEEKRYVSSKRAAKVTGYAKDYIGQLCREGRVPARLVGRSWYVLESAIHDHRFGNPEPRNEAHVSAKQTPTAGWASPRYEASNDAILPSVNRLRDAMPTRGASDGEPLQDSWRAWFDRVTEPPVALAEVVAERVSESRAEAEIETPRAEEAEEVSIPIRTVYDLPPEDLLPRYTPRIESETEFEVPVVSEIQLYRGGRGVVRTIQVAGAVFAVLIAMIAVIGTGYLDRYILSNSQVGLLAGVSFYNR